MQTEDEEVEMFMPIERADVGTERDPPRLAKVSVYMEIESKMENIEAGDSPARKARSMA